MARQPPRPSLPAWVIRAQRQGNARPTTADRSGGGSASSGPCRGPPTPWRWAKAARKLTPQPPPATAA
eukprot:12817256-Alexandrium_andersonii.AAC.1